MALRDDAALLILTSLAGGPKHGYAMIEDIATMSGVRLGPGTLYGAIGRLEGEAMIEALQSDDRAGLSLRSGHVRKRALGRAVSPLLPLRRLLAALLWGKERLRRSGLCRRGPSQRRRRH